MTYQLQQKGCLHDNAHLMTSLVAWERGYTAGILIPNVKDLQQYFFLIYTLTKSIAASIYLSPGPQNVNVIKWCACDRSDRLNKCRRLHKWMVYFQDTPNEKAVNVGHCAGNSVCRADLGMGFNCAYLFSKSRLSILDYAKSCRQNRPRLT